MPFGTWNEQLATRTGKLQENPQVFDSHEEFILLEIFYLFMSAPFL